MDEGLVKTDCFIFLLDPEMYRSHFYDKNTLTTVAVDYVSMWAKNKSPGRFARVLLCLCRTENVSGTRCMVEARQVLQWWENYTDAKGVIIFIVLITSQY